MMALLPVLLMEVSRKSKSRKLGGALSWCGGNSTRLDADGVRRPLHADFT